MTIDHAHGISVVDTEFVRPRFDASYLVIEKGRAAFIDVGTNHAHPLLLAALAQKGLGVEHVDWVILTHVHLDHAGGAGAAMAAFPNARLVVHPRGARHMIDPTALIKGATAVYGEEEMARSYGTLVPVPADRVVEAPDGHVVDLAGRKLVCLDAPGHARHHVVIWDERSRSFFTGDTFGLSYRDFDTDRGAFIIPTTTPVQFEPDAYKDSIVRMLTHFPAQMFLTHYARVDDVERLGQDLVDQLDAMVAIGKKHAQGPDRHAKIAADLTDLYTSRARAHGVTLPDADIATLLAVDIELNTQGMEVWLDRPAR